MSLVKWNPYREMEKLFGEFFETAPKREWPLWLRLKPEIVVPDIDMYDRKNEIVVKAELPGMTKDHIDLTIHEGSLTLKGEVKKEGVYLLTKKGKWFRFTLCESYRIRKYIWWRKS